MAVESDQDMVLICKYLKADPLVRSIKEVIEAKDRAPLVALCLISKPVSVAR